RSLGKAIIETLKEGLELRVDDERNFYMRFDKQKAFEEEYQLAEGEDTIATRCKLKVFPAEKAHAVLKLKEFLENL
ncbi:MAG: RNA-binding domain-containing protein, partial [Candidatus Thermoplasmatota archaeon]